MTSSYLVPLISVSPLEIKTTVRRSEFSAILLMPAMTCRKSAFFSNFCCRRNVAAASAMSLLFSPHHLASGNLPALTVPPVMRFDIVSQVCHRALDRLDEIGTIHSHSAHTDNGLAFGNVVRYSKDLSKLGETIGGALNHLVGGLASRGIKHLNVLR